MQFSDDGAVIFACQRQFRFLGELPAQGVLYGCQFGLFLSAFFPELFHTFFQPLAQKVVHALEQAGQAEFVIKRVYQIVGPELPLAWAADGYTESVLAARGLRMADNVHGKAPVAAEQGFCADVARNLLDAAQQQVFHFFAVPVGQQPFIRAQLNPDFFLVLFPDNMCIGVAATQVCGMVGFLLGKTGIRTFEPLQAVAHPVLAPLVL